MSSAQDWIRWVKVATLSVAAVALLAFCMSRTAHPGRSAKAAEPPADRIATAVVVKSPDESEPAMGPFADHDYRRRWLDSGREVRVYLSTDPEAVRLGYAAEAERRGLPAILYVTADGRVTPASARARIRRSAE